MIIDKMKLIDDGWEYTFTCNNNNNTSINNYCDDR